MRTKSIPVACALAALALLLPATGQAGTFNVNTTADTSVGGGCVTDPTCSLRDAVLAAGETADPEDLVLVPAGQYSISNGELSVNTPGTVTIRGEGARKTIINANQTSRVFKLSADLNVVEGLTVTGGSTSVLDGGFPAGDGGGILVFEAGEAILRGLNVTGNVATQNGGGISAPPESGARSAVTIVDSTIAGNQVTGGLAEALGGGVYVLGKLSITNSTVFGNSAATTGTGVVQGGGVLLAIDPNSTEPSEATIVNSTIAGNSVGTGGLGGGLGAVNPTVTPGGSAVLRVKNTIVAGNTGPAGPSDCAVAATVTSDHNLSGDASCMFGDAGSKQNANPLLGALANNGGETDTLALPEGSPAIDAGTNDGCPANDQRGVTRPQGPACDIGAYERAVTPTPPAAASADLRLKAKPKPKRPTAGGKLAFVLTVRNAGPDAATGTVLKGTVPALTRKAVGPKVNGKRACKLTKAKKGKRKLTCKLGDVAAGKAKKVRVVVTPAHAGKLRVRARVRSGLADPNLKNNKARAGVKVRA